MRVVAAAGQIWPLLQRPALRSHAFSLAGQIAGALPFFAISIYLARVSGLRATGEFAALSGLSATAYMVAWWGFRSLMVADRMQRFSVGTYLAARVAFATAATSVVGVSGALWGFDPGLIAAVILLRLGEGVTDLTLGAGQVTAVTHAVRRYGLQNLVRAFIVLGAIAAGYLFQAGAASLLLVCASAVALAVVLVWSWPIVSSARASDRAAEYVELIKGAFWFAVAGVTCAAVTSLPRMLLPILHGDGERFGAAGAALSVATFFGMAFYGSWVRWAPRLEIGRLRLRDISRFGGETALILLLLLAAAWFVLPTATAWLFYIQAPETIGFVREVLVTAALFFAAMNVANLFKATRFPWLETLVYALPLGFAFALAHALKLSVPMLLLMLAGGIFSVTAGSGLWLAVRAKERPKL